MNFCVFPKYENIHYLELGMKMLDGKTSSVLIFASIEVQCLKETTTFLKQPKLSYLGFLAVV